MFTSTDSAPMPANVVSKQPIKINRPERRNILPQGKTKPRQFASPARTGTGPSPARLSIQTSFRAHHWGAPVTFADGIREAGLKISPAELQTNGPGNFLLAH
jgi:hypothetical protein